MLPTLERLGENNSLPALFLSFDLGEKLANAARNSSFTVAVRFVIPVTIENVIPVNNICADTPTGDPTQTILIGSHADSVPTGPGINDKDNSLLQPDLTYPSDVSSTSLSSDFNASESVKSFALVEATHSVHSAAVCRGFERTKNEAMTRKLEDQAMRAASEERDFLCKEFLKKHYCSRIGSNNFEELYVRILSVIKDTNRVYYLMKRARHSCFGLVQATNNDDQLLALFQFLDDFLS
ncbi:unnamed protein product [Rotaria sp. Silwood1]|nr:unnamed protein product [Rotaria sp. Silwood1]CAF4726561.1 unnamed protein product [Rotaria sp. Silwood1]